MNTISLKIDQTTCIKCGHCVRICPAGIFLQSEKRGEIKVHKEQNCIRCGHCVGVCPTASVIHSLFPPEKVHGIDRKQLPSPEQVMLLCKARRSNRAFTKDPVPSEKLDLIVEAAHRAPTASNLQKVEFTVVTDPAKLHQISAFTVGVFSSMLKKADNPFVKPFIKAFAPQLLRYIPIFKNLKRRFESGEYDGILRGATAVLFFHTPKKSTSYGVEDCNLAYQNGSLMAESLGVSQFYTGFVQNAIRQDKKGRLAGMLGIEGDIHAGMALGMPEFQFLNYIDKEDARVNRV